MNPRKPFNVIFSTLLLMGLGACGGGGNGSSSNGEPIIYNGNISPAQITADNANILVANIMASSSGTAISLGVDVTVPVSAQTFSLVNTIQSLTHSTHRAAIQGIANRDHSLAASLTASVAVNETDNCTNSGTVRITGDISQDGTGTLTLNFVDCDDGDAIINGNATFRTDAYDSFTNIILDGTLQSNALNFSDSLSNMTFSGTIQTETSLFDQGETLTINAVIRDNSSTKLVMAENFVTILIYDNYFNPTTHTETITGRIYDSAEGYVDIATTSPLVYSNEGLQFPDSGGPLILTGAENSKARLLVPSAIKTRIEVDSDGNDIFEEAGVYLWVNLTGAPASNDSPAATVTLSPAAPSTSDTLTTTVTATDPDGDPLYYTYSWTRNGILITGAITPEQAGSQFTKGDIIAVTVAISDGTVSVLATTSIVFTDTPPRFATILPVDAPYGVPLTIQAHADDVDGDLIEYSLAYGPAGMQIDQSGTVSWTPSGPMFNETLEVHFGVRAEADGVIAETTGTITASDPGHAPPLVRTGLRIPYSADGLRIADFDGDSRNEILMSDQYKVLNTWVYEQSSNSYVQNWVYPFDLSPGEAISAIAVHDINGDGNPDIIVAAGTRITILDGVTRKTIGRIDDSYHAHYSITVNDLDGNGKKEIIYIGANDFYTYQPTINVYDANDFNLIWQSPALDLGASLAVGNVDNDPALEIVTAKGYVYDGATHVNQWAYGPGFGNLVDTGDLDANGIEEIIGTKQNVTVYSAVLKSPLWEIQQFSDALKVTNIDEDPQAEIVVGAGSYGYITAYDGSTGTGIQQWSIDPQNYGVSSIAIGDTDNDGVLELVWASGIGSSGPASLVVAGLNPMIQIEWTNEIFFSPWGRNVPFQLNGPFIGGRWLTTSPGQKQLVFASISTNSGYDDGTRLVGIEPATGEITISSETGSNWNGYAALTGVDYDNDGIDELFLTTANTYDGYFTAYDFGLDQAEWISEYGLGSGQAITHGDLNSDGHDDLIAVTTWGYIYAYDVFNSTLIWKSTQLPGYGIFDVEVTDLDGDNKLEIMAASSDTLSVYKQDPTYGFILRDSKTVQAIAHLTADDIDNDGIPDIIAGSSDYYVFGTTSAIHIYDGASLNEKATYTLTGVITDLAITPVSGSRRNLIVAISDQPYSGHIPEDINQLIMIDPLTGNKIWSSPEIIGQIQRNSISFADINNDGNQELVIGTSQAMYITR